MKKELFFGIVTLLIGLSSLNTTVKAQSIHVDSLIEAVSKLPYQQQVQQLTQINYAVLVANTNKLIPVFEKYLNSEEIKKWPVYQAQLYEQLSLAYYIGGKYVKNFESGLKALHLYDSLNLLEHAGRMYGELGYRTKRIDLKKAFELMQHGIHILLTINNKEQLAKIYDNYGVLHEMNQQYDSAVYFYKKALSLKIALNDRHGLPFTLNNISVVFIMANQPDSAIVYLDSATHIRIGLNDKSGLAECYSLYGDYYQLTNKLDKAVEYFNRALQLADTLNYPYLQSEMYKKLSFCFEQKNNPFKALSLIKKHIQLNDSLVNAETNNAISDLQIKYETEKKEQENISLAKENKLQQLNLTIEKQNKRNLIWFFIVIIFLIIVLFFLVFNRFRIKKKLEIERQIAEQKRIGFEAVIEAEENERIRIAKDLHDGIGQQISAVNMQFQMLSEKLISSGIELQADVLKMKKMITETGTDVRLISHKMMPRALTEFGLIDALEDMIDKSFSNGKIKCHFDHHNMEERLPQNIEIGLYRIAQELINNILKHAGATQVEVQLVRKSSHCILIIQDNGKGIDASGKKGIGIQNINSRLHVINGELNLESDSHSGTTAIVRVDLTKP